MSNVISNQAAELARCLARDAEAVCRHYLANGRRQGRYWTVGDVRNTPGRSMFVRLSGPDYGPGAAGKWTDAASAEHGDLLDVIRESCGLIDFRDVFDEARRFLCLPRSEPAPPTREPPAPDASAAARRLFRAGRPVPGTLAEAYLRARGITARLDWPSLRFHPALWYRPVGYPDRDAARESWPGLLAAVTDAAGRVTGVHRTYLAPPGLDRHRPDKAPLADPRRALGRLLGNGVRFGPEPNAPADVLAAGEGIETMLALKSVLPALPMIAALSANHLAALDLAPMLARLYVARDRDTAGRMAAERLHARGRDAGIEVRDLMPAGSDFNVDLCRLGPDAMLARLADQLAPADFLRFVRRRDAA